MPDLEDYMTDEQRDDIHNNRMSDEDYRKAEREAQERFDREIEEEMSDPYSDDEKDQMGSSEFFKDND